MNANRLAEAMAAPETRKLTKELFVKADEAEVSVGKKVAAMALALATMMSTAPDCKDKEQMIEAVCRAVALGARV